MNYQPTRLKTYISLEKKGNRESNVIIKISKDKIFIRNDFYEQFAESDNLLKVT